MIFVYKYWDKFCKDLSERGIVSIPAKEVSENMTSFLVLKHDIENNVSKAYKLAQIESKYGHRGSYYAHAYLLEDHQNVTLLQKMKDMGHEISYHYDVMDSCRGSIEKATVEFENNKRKFESVGFALLTVCQHGNPIIEREGYTSNRDFFRNANVRSHYPNISDIMVNYKENYHVDYSYYSDAGRKFNLIYDPINNDVLPSDDKNIMYDDFDELLNKLSPKAIISTHPHRWTGSELSYVIKERVFNTIKATAKVLVKIPICKKIMSKYYYLAKKI